MLEYVYNSTQHSHPVNTLIMKSYIDTWIASELFPFDALASDLSEHFPCAHRFFAVLFDKFHGVSVDSITRLFVVKCFTGEPQHYAMIIQLDDGECICYAMMQCEFVHVKNNNAKSFIKTLIFEILAPQEDRDEEYEDYTDYDNDNDCEITPTNLFLSSECPDESKNKNNNNNNTPRSEMSTFHSRYPSIPEKNAAVSKIVDEVVARTSEWKRDCPEITRVAVVRKDEASEPIIAFYIETDISSGDRIGIPKSVNIGEYELPVGLYHHSHPSMETNHDNFDSLPLIHQAHARAVNRIIEKYSNDIFQRTNTSAITGCVDKHGVTTIVIYVHHKGMIVDNDAPFPNTLDELNVIIREGGLEYHGYGADECNVKHAARPLKIGISIGVERSDKIKCRGTIGGVVINNDKSEEMYILTAKHVITASKDFEKCNTTAIFFQPAHTPYFDDANKIGSEFVLLDSHDEEIGVDIGLIKLRDGIKAASSLCITNDSWGIIVSLLQNDFSNLPQNLPKLIETPLDIAAEDGFPKPVFKIGIKTGITAGRVSQFFAIVNSPGHLRINHTTQRKKYLHKFIVNPIKSNVYEWIGKFSEQGDSGALVWCLNDSNTALHPCGFVSSGLGDDSIVVPIMDVIPHLKARGLAFKFD